jgi:DNA-binding HxlR family transcriptional regulator
MYGITIAGHRTNIIVKPFIYSNVKVVKTVVIITDRDPEAHKTSMSAADELKEYGVETEIILIDNIFNFQKMFYVAKKILRERGKPNWINVTAGPGIAIAALISVFSRSNLVYFKEGIINSEVISVETENIVKGFGKIEKMMPLLEYINKEGYVEFNTLSSAFKAISKATLSRMLTLLKDSGLIESKGAGRGGQRKQYYISSLGKNILS